MGWSWLLFMSTLKVLESEGTGDSDLSSTRLMTSCGAATNMSSLASGMTTASVAVVDGACVTL